MPSQSEKVALITGASSGIGAYLAREYAAHGYLVAICARREDRLRELTQELGTDRVLAIQADVTSREDMDRAVAETLKRWGQINTVVANAGFGVAGPLSKLEVEDYRQQFETNVFGVLHTVYASLDALKTSRGSLALVGSVAGHIAVPGQSAYSMSKFAVRALALALYHELNSVGISVTLISPGFVASEIRQVDNRGKLIQGAHDPLPHWVMMPTDRAAKKIFQAIESRKREAIITGHGKVMVFLNHHCSWLIHALFRLLKFQGRPEPKRS